MDNINAVTDRSDLKISGQLTPNNAEVNGSLSENKGMSARLESVRRVSVPAVLSGLADVDISAPVDGQTLVYDAEKGVWKNGEGNVVANLGDLKDVDLEGLNDGEVIKYNFQTGKWEPATLTYADVGALPSTTKIPEVIDRLDTYSTKDALSAYQGNVLKNLIDSNWGIPVKKEMPEASLEYINGIFQYIGETNEEYTHGYFYQCFAEDYTRYYAYKSYKNEIFYVKDETPTLESVLYLLRITEDSDTSVTTKEFYPATDDYPNIVIKYIFSESLNISKTGSNVRTDTYDRSKTDDDYDGDIYWKQINVQPSENNLDLSIVGGALNQTYEEEENAQGAETTNPVALNSTVKETNSKLQAIVDFLQEKKRLIFNAAHFKLEGLKVNLSDLVASKLPVYFETYADFITAVNNGEIEEGQRFTIREGVYKQASIKTHLTDITSGTLLDGDVAGAKAVSELNNKLGEEVIYAIIEFGSDVAKYSGGTIGTRGVQLFKSINDYTDQGYEPISATICYTRNSEAYIPIVMLYDSTTSRNVMLNLYRSNTSAISDATTRVKVAFKKL